MKKKLLFIIIPLLFSSCLQLQVNIGSSVNIVQVGKPQLITGDDNEAEMEGSKLKELIDQLDQSGEATIPVPGQ